MKPTAFMFLPTVNKKGNIAVPLMAAVAITTVTAGAHVTKFVNGRNILNKTIANGVKSAISRQTKALNVHATQLIISGARYVASNVFATVISQTPIAGK